MKRITLILLIIMLILCGCDKKEDDYFPEVDGPILSYRNVDKVNDLKCRISFNTGDDLLVEGENAKLLHRYLIDNLNDLEYKTEFSTSKTFICLAFYIGDNYLDFGKKTDDEYYGIYTIDAKGYIYETTGSKHLGFSMFSLKSNEKSYQMIKSAVKYVCNQLGDCKRINDDKIGYHSMLIYNKKKTHDGFYIKDESGNYWINKRTGERTNEFGLPIDENGDYLYLSFSDLLE